MAIPASFQTGAADSYYFTLSFFMALISMAGIASLTRENAAAAGPVLTASAVGWGGLIVAVSLVLAGYTGVTDVRDQHKTYLAHKRCLDKLPRPFFSNYSYYGLPWVTLGNEPFVVSYQYFKERKAGKKFEQNGVGGLIASGRFNALAFNSPAPPKTFDGASLDNFVSRPDFCRDMAVMLRKPE
jgi:hypothetical protein